TGNTSAHYVESDVEFSRDVWQHFAFTVVGPDDVRVFVNGTKKTGDPPSATDYREDLYDFFTLGGWKTSGEFNFVVGKLSYAAAWNKALSDAEVAALQTSPPDAVAVSDLLSYWRLQNNGEDSVGAADLSAIGTGSLTWDSDEPNLAGGSTLIFTDRSQRVRGYQAADLARLQLR